MSKIQPMMKKPSLFRLKTKNLTIWNPNEEA